MTSRPSHAGAYDVSAKHDKNTIHFIVPAIGLEDALDKAMETASAIFHCPPASLKLDIKATRRK